MLKFLRHKSNQKKLFLGLAIVILPSFLIWGVTLDKSGVGPTAGKIGSHDVSTGEFLRQYQAVRREIMLFRGVDPDKIPAGSVDFESMTWDRILLLEDAKRKGVRTSDSDIIAWLNRQQAFSSNGQFNPGLYKMFVQKELRVDPREFEEEVRGFLTLQKSLQSFAGTDTVNEADARKTYTERFAPRDLQYVVIAADPNAAPASVTEAEIKQLYDSIQAVMLKPEKYKLRYVFAEKTAPPAPEAKKALEESGLAKAAESGLKVQETGFVTRKDPLPGIGYSQKAAEAIFGLEQGGHTPWVELENGTAMFELVERQPSEKMTFEEARPELETKLSEGKRDQVLFDRALNVRKAMDTKGFEDAARENGIPVLESKGFKHGAYLDKAGTLDDFNTSVAPLAAGKISQPIRTAGGFVIIRIGSIGQVDDAEWQKQKDALLQELNSKAREESYRVNLEKLRSQLKVNSKAMVSIFPAKYRTEQNSAAATGAVPLK